MTKTRLAGLIFVLSLGLQALVPFLIPSASAATLTNTYVRLDRMETGVATTWELGFTTASAGATSLSVDFTSTWTTNSGALDTTTQNVGACTDSSASSISGGTGSATGSTVSVSGFTGLTASTAYCVAFTTSDSVTTPTAAQYSPVVTVGSDSVTTNVDVVSTGDQVTVNASVNPSFTMVLSGNTDNLGALTTASVTSSPTPTTATVNTNAPNGWYIWGKDSNAGLNSPTASYTIASNCSGGTGTNSTLSAGTEGYNLGAVATSQSGGSGTVTIATPFVGGTSKGGGMCTGYQSVATSNGTASNSVVTLTNNAAIAGYTKAATDYTDVETFVGAGLF